LTQPTSDTLAKPQPQNQMSQADVWSIVYELHRIAPSILTTVIGTLANYLSVPEIEQRQLVVKLLGRLFGKSSKLALQFRPCFRDWLRRSKDVNADIRLSMVEHLLQLMIANATNSTDDDEISKEVQPVLAKCMETDPSSDVRLKCIHGLCDVAYKQTSNTIHLDLWRLVGTRVSSKHKQERKDALTGLAQTYYKQYLTPQLRNVQLGGDDCDVQVLQQVLHTHTAEEDRYSWIPGMVFQAASWTEDADLQNRVWQLMDDLLLGSELPNSSKKWTATARAVGLALVLDSLESNAHAWMCQLLQQRAKLQQALGLYIDARSKIQKHVPGK
jgi:hypothetical protein